MTFRSKERLSKSWLLRDGIHHFKFCLVS